MRIQQHIQVFEYQKLRYGENDVFKKHHFEAMVKFNEENQNKYFTIIHKGVQFNQYVGVIQVGQLVIEILPKADKHSDGDKNLWQNILLRMLEECRYFPVNTVSETNLRKRNNSILDLYFKLYLDEVEILLKRGLIKKYRKVQSNQSALKGRLLFAQNIQQNLVHKERFYTEHTVYDKNHLLHQIIYQGLLIVKEFVNDRYKDQLHRLLFEFQDFDRVNIYPKDFQKIKLNRNNQYYERALQIAEILILNYAPTLSYGSQKLLALLFDMNKLWEEYIYRILHKHRIEGMSVDFQNSQCFWENKTIRPDIVIRKGEETYVIDTKWKVIEVNKPSDDDLKQMFTYNLHWNAKKTLLLYPKVNQEDSQFGVFHYNNQENRCKLGFIDVTRIINSRGEMTVIAKEIIEKFGN